MALFICQRYSGLISFKVEVKFVRLVSYIKNPQYTYLFKIRAPSIHDSSKGNTAAANLTELYNLLSISSLAFSTWQRTTA